MSGCEGYLWVVICEFRMILFRCLLSHRCQFLNNCAQLGRGQGPVCDETLQEQGTTRLWDEAWKAFQTDSSPSVLGPWKWLRFLASIFSRWRWFQCDFSKCWHHCWHPARSGNNEKHKGGKRTVPAKTESDFFVSCRFSRICRRWHQHQRLEGSCGNHIKQWLSCNTFKVPIVPKEMSEDLF